MSYYFLLSHTGKPTSQIVPNSKDWSFLYLLVPLLLLALVGTVGVFLFLYRHKIASPFINKQTEKGNERYVIFLLSLLQTCVLSVFLYLFVCTYELLCITMQVDLI